MKNLGVLLPALALAVLPLAADAHERHQFVIGEEKYEFTVGSQDEPITVDDRTGVFLNVRELHGEAAEADHHDPISRAITGLDQTLKVEMIAGDMKRVTDLSPIHGEPGSYQNKFYPTVATTLSYRIFGTVEETPFDYTFTCTPAGHAKAEEDKSEVKVSDGVMRVFKTGSFSCPSAKEDLGFPEQSASVLSLSTQTAAAAAETKQRAMIGIGLGAIALLLAGYAVVAGRQRVV